MEATDPPLARSGLDFLASLLPAMRNALSLLNKIEGVSKSLQARPSQEMGAETAGVPQSGG